jgi:hypothetical protein
MSAVTLSMANRGLVLNNSVGSVNLFPCVHYDNWSRGQLSRNLLGGAVGAPVKSLLSEFRFKLLLRIG